MDKSTNGLLFFSIIIPAHNEERYVGKTLEKLQKLDYQKERYEVIVVENASSDDTYKEARRFEGQNIKAFSVSVKGVSSAKNAGIERLSAQSEWVIFLDADTHLERGFLKNLNKFLLKTADKNYSVGTTRVLPLSQKIGARIWFAFYDFGHFVTKSSYAIQLFKRSILDQISFDEDMALGEDLKLIREAVRYGRFFYFSTSEVYTSTRRFEEEGWFRVFFHWMFVAILPTKLQRRFSYKVVR